MFSNDFRGNRSYVIRLNSLNIKSEIWRQFLNQMGLVLQFFCSKLNQNELNMKNLELFSNPLETH